MQRVDEYIQALDRSGRSKDTCDWHRKVVTVFCQNFEEVTDANIEEAVRIANKELYYRHGQARPKGVLKIFKEWCEKGTVARARRIPGMYRPDLCLRNCKHNYSSHCTYNTEEFLYGVIGGVRCHYFQEPEKAEVVKETEPGTPYDWVFRKRCTYTDSHSARWKE